MAGRWTGLTWSICTKVVSRHMEGSGYGHKVVGLTRIVGHPDYAA